MKERYTASTMWCFAALGLALSLVARLGDAAVPSSQLSALKDFAQSTAVDGWTFSGTWLEGDPCENAWWGVGCDATNSTIVTLSLTQNALGGSISTTLDRLVDLQSLLLGVNSIGGVLPTALGNMTALRYLELQRNPLQGELMDFSSLTSLREIFLFSTDVSGTIPTTIGLCSKLSIVLFGDALLSGALPSEIGLLTKMDSFHVNGNPLGGSLPSELNLLSNVEQLYLQQCGFEGTLPSLNKLTRLQSLMLSNNALNGTLPDLSPLKKLSALFIDGNQFAGALDSNRLPPSLQRLYAQLNEFDSLDVSGFDTEQLHYLFVNGNNLNMSIPSSIGTFTELIELDLRGNSFYSSIPTELGRCTRLQQLWLDGTELTGPLPSELGALPHLARFELLDTPVSGTLPTFTSSALRSVHIENTFVGGVIPSSLFSLVTSLRLSNNQISGPLPSSISNKHGLVELWIDQNNLTGRFPTALPTELTSLSLASNNLIGTLPSSVWALKNLQTLDLRHNFLNGTLPSQVATSAAFSKTFPYMNPVLQYAQILSTSTTNVTHGEDVYEEDVVQGFAIYDNYWAVPVPQWCSLSGTGMCSSELSVTTYTHFETHPSTTLSPDQKRKKRIAISVTTISVLVGVAVVAGVVAFVIRKRGSLSSRRQGYEALSV